MARPAGVTASAVVCVLGSAFTLLLAAGAVAALFVQLPAGAGPPAPDMAQVRPLMIGFVVVLVAFSGLGVWTAVGLFRLRPWARISVLVFGGFLVAMSLMGEVFMATAPLPASAVPNVPPGMPVRAMMMAGYAAPLLIGVWWLVQFNTAATKAAFAAGTRAIDEPGGRPLSVSIIGWWMLIGGVLTIPAMLFRPAALAFGVILTGWNATLVYVVFAAVQISGGQGLLKLQQPARQLAIAWFSFGAANSLALALLPGFDARMMAYRLAMPLAAHGLAADRVASISRAVVVAMALPMAVPIWFLVRRRKAFHPPQDRS